MTQYTRQRVILAKAEATYGTDPNPTGAANAIRCSNITVTPIGGSTAERQIVYPNFGSLPVALMNKQVMVSFDVELAGQGAAGSAPGYAALLKACGLAETLNPGVSAVYQPQSSGFGSVALYANESGTLHKVLGARGNVGFDFTPNALPTAKFSFCGLWNPPSAVALPAPVYTSFHDAIEVNKVNTPTFTLHGFTPVLERMGIDLGWSVTHRDRPNAEIVQLSNRMSKGSVSIEAPDLGTKDFFAEAYNQTLGPMQLIHGTVAGNIIQVDAPQVQLLAPSYADANGIRCIGMSMILARNAADDEFVLTIK